MFCVPFWPRILGFVKASDGFPEPFRKGFQGFPGVSRVSGTGRDVSRMLKNGGK